ncbi:hypothetical protein, partial [Burkholderia glumae]|uniref:hypothetical protein n=1 Tax=Burkholderia glumae TaxID=337 RepID=UPI0019D6BEF7
MGLAARAGAAGPQPDRRISYAKPAAAEHGRQRRRAVRSERGADLKLAYPLPIAGALDDRKAELDLERAGRRMQADSQTDSQAGASADGQAGTAPGSIRGRPSVPISMTVNGSSAHSPSTARRPASARLRRIARRPRRDAAEGP